MESIKKPIKNLTLPIISGLNKLLLNQYPNLSPSELKVCTLLVLNISSKEIGELIGRNVRTIEFTRYNIRKKMNLSPDENLVKQFILLAEEEKDKNSLYKTTP